MIEAVPCAKTPTRATQQRLSSKRARQQGRVLIDQELHHHLKEKAMAFPKRGDDIVFVYKY